MQDVQTYFDKLGREIGAEFFLVGGCLRDEALGVVSDDFDLVARKLDADTLHARLLDFGTVDVIGDAFEVFAFHPAGGTGRFEVALPRTESTTGTGHKGFTPVHDPFLPIEQDLIRRDFTVNALAKNVHTGQLHDPLNGLLDIRLGLLRAANPDVFADDALRVLRGIRFVSKLGFKLERDTAALVTRFAHRLGDLPGERFQKELTGIVAGLFAADALRLARDLGALPHFLPELSLADGCKQNKWHSHDVFEHTVRVLENTITDDWVVKLAALFHDIAKPVVKWVDLEVDPTGNPHFYQHEGVPGSGDHEEVGEQIALDILARFKFSKEVQLRASGLVGLHMFSQDARSRRPAARRLLQRLLALPGDREENVTALFAIRYGDIRGGKVYEEGSIEAKNFDEALQINQRFEALVREELENEAALTVKDLAVNGHDLMGLGFKGVEIGNAQKFLLDHVVEDPECNTKLELLRLLRERQRGL